MYKAVLMNINNIQINLFLLKSTIKNYTFVIISATFMLLVAISFFFLPSQADAAMLGKEIDSKWSFAIGMEPSGEYGRSLAVGVMPNSINPDVTDFLFQAQGNVRIQIQVGYDGPAIGDTIITSISYQQGSTKLYDVEPNIVEVLLPTSAFYENEDQGSGFSHTLFYTFFMAVVDEDGNESDEQTFTFGINITKFRHLSLKSDYGAQSATVFVTDLKYVDDGSGYAIQRTAVIGEPVELSTDPRVNIYDAIFSWLSPWTIRRCHTCAGGYLCKMFRYPTCLSYRQYKLWSRNNLVFGRRH